jgi:endogenous inhibitor of DNA gyrase (YacG/DUF329 family)
MAQRIVPCPICDKVFDFDASQAAPFCSPRCRQIDLKRWLGEEYSVPVVRDPDSDEEAPPSDDRFDDE